MGGMVAILLFRFGNLSPEFICCKSHICQIGMYFLFSCLACSLILETLHKTYLRERFCITPGVSLSTVLFDQPETWKRHSSQARGRIFDAVMCMPCYAELWFARKYVKGMKRGRAMWKGENARGEKSGANEPVQGPRCLVRSGIKHLQSCYIVLAALGKWKSQVKIWSELL